jgi:hypothetical protein
MNDIERKKKQNQIEKSKTALRRLNDFSYLDKRQEKNRAKNEKLRLRSQKRRK